MKSCAHWLNWKCGIDLGAAREKVRVARCAGETCRRSRPRWQQGRLSYAKVRAMTRVATPANESYLLNIALCGTASHVEHVVRGYRRALDAEELSREAIQQRDQSLLYYTEADGSLVIRGRVPAEIGALFVRALSGGRGFAPDSKRRFRGNVFGRSAPPAQAPCRGAGDARRELPRDRAAGPIRAETATRSSCTWMPRPCSMAMPAAASSSMDLRSPWRRPGACPATRASSGSSRTRRASPSTSAARPGPFRRRSGVP